MIKHVSMKMVPDSRPKGSPPTQRAEQLLHWLEAQGRRVTLDAKRRIIIQPCKGLSSFELMALQLFGVEMRQVLELRRVH